MKKAFLLVCILSLSVITTACINNIAVQELNSKAMTYMEQGDYAEAIQRLKSSIDLDDSIFETHYNLAVAYTKSEDYANAMQAYQKAITLKPEFADSYYSLAVTEENIVTDIKSGLIKVDENGNLETVEQNQSQETSESNEIIENTTANNSPVLTETDQAYIKKLLNDAVKNYNLYLTKAQTVDDIDEVKKHIAELEEKIDPVSAE